MNLCIRDVLNSTFSTKFLYLFDKLGNVIDNPKLFFAETQL